LYSTRRTAIQSFIENHLQTAFAGVSTNVAFEESYIKLEDVLIEEIKLPEFVKQAIEEKEKVRHMSDAYEFRIEMEQKERQRKRIEAEGIRNFQEIVAPGITDSYLRWRGIEATLKLAESDNAKVVIIGNGADGLPIILNTDSSQNAKLSSKTQQITKADNDDTDRKFDDTEAADLPKETAEQSK
jgi:prohibitin 2